MRRLGSWAAALAAALVLAAAAWVQAPALRAGFVADDFLFLDQVRGRGLVAALGAPDPIGNFLRPVGRALWYWALARAGGESPLVFHIASLTLFLLVLVLLFVLVRRLAGALAATVATAFLALGHAPDVAVRWGAGAQDLLAVTFALATLLLHRAGRRAPAALCLVLALLSKETVAATPLIALLLDRRANEPWRATARRAWPLFAALGAWAATWLATVPARRATGAALSFVPANVPAALAHLVQTAAGLEWPPGGGPTWPLSLAPVVPLALALVAIVLVPPATGNFRARLPSTRAALLAGLAWALLGALPVALVVPVWSAYQYLFALCGVALALGAALAYRPRWIAAMAVLLLGWSAAGSRSLDEFAQTPERWATLSHVNARYLERADMLTAGFVAGSRGAWPSLPAGSTVLIAGLPAWSGVQAGGGPVLRWAYRDTSLRATFTTTFTRARIGPGPLQMLTYRDGAYTRRTLGAPELTGLALNLLLDDALPSAREALLLSESRGGGTAELHYTLAWVEWALGDTAAAVERLRRAGATAAGGARPEIEAAMREVARGDTAAAYERMGRAVGRYALDPGAHALLADLALARPDAHPLAILESFATVALAPQWPDAWRRWAALLVHDQRLPRARLAVERWFEVAGPAGERDAEMRALRDWLRSTEAGGVAARAAVRRAGAAPR